MEDIMQFLLIVGIIAFGIFRQYSKESKKKSENKAPVPTLEYEVVKPVIPKMERKQAPPKMKIPLPHEGIRNTNIPSQEREKVATEDSEFSIHSAEEARRAIIWSEILQRKY